MTQQPDTHAIALYLEAHPHFFDDHPELLAGLRLNTALGGRTVSLQDRQVEVLREKIRQLELKLANLGRVAKANEAIMANFHRWTLRLLTAETQETLPGVMVAAMRDTFAVPAASLRLWQAGPQAQAWAAEGDVEAVRAYADQLSQPYCGPAKDQPGVSWLDDAASMQSAVLIALRAPGQAQSFGLLVLGSPDPQRFSSDLATDFLTQIGETASAALQGMTA